MQNKLFSIIRHLITGAAGVVGLALDKGFITPEDAEKLTPQADRLLDTVAMIIAIVLTRLILFGAAKVKLSQFFNVVPLAFCLGVLAIGATLSLSSCGGSGSAFLKDVTGSIVYHTDSGAKAVIDVVDGKAKPRLRIPIHTEDGTGYVDLNSGK